MFQNKKNEYVMNAQGEVQRGDDHKKWKETTPASNPTSSSSASARTGPYEYESRDEGIARHYSGWSDAGWGTTDWTNPEWRQTGWRSDVWVRTTPNDAEMTDRSGDNANPSSCSAEQRNP